jgi:hypothetical protein
MHNLAKALITGICLLFLFSCEDSATEEKKIEVEQSVKPTESTNTEQEIKPELTAEEAITLNDLVMIQIDYIENQLNQLQELDAEDADSTVMFQKADSLVTYVQNFNLVEFQDRLPTLNSSKFLESAFALIEMMDSKATIFKDYAGENSIPDLEWEEGWVNELNQIIEPVFFQFIEARATFIEAQEKFIKLHGAELTDV